MKRFIKLLNLLFLSSFIAINTGCYKDGENSVTQELLRPVSVFISGNVISSDTGEGVSGVEVRIQRVLSNNSTEFIQSGGSDLMTVTDASGNFEFTGAIELEVDSYQHFLHISDPDNDYYTNDSQVVYSIRDAELVYNNVRIISRNPKTTTIVTGTVCNVLSTSDAPVPGVSVRLTHATDTTIVHTATTGADGTFAIESVNVSEYIMNIDGSGITDPGPFVVEDSTVKLSGDAVNDLGSIRIAPTIDAEDLRVVLQWNESADMDLDIQYTFPKPNLDFNHLGTKTFDMEASDFSMNPAYGFAEGTAYWPENMGGEARSAITDRDEPGRYTLDKSSAAIYHTINNDSYWPGTDNKFVVDSETVAELDRNSTDGSTPEVLTIHKQNFLSEYPGNMSYYYYQNSEKYYPAALGIFTVKNAGSTSIYNSGAVVKVYQGNSFLGKFSISDLAISTGESNKKYWTVLQIEQGYKTSAPASINDIYFRVVPYGSQSATLEVAPPSPGFYFNLVGLPYSKTYTAYADFTPYIDRINYAIKHMRMIGTEDGYVYSMLCSDTTDSEREYRWRTGWYWHFPGSEVTSIVLNRNLLNTYYIGLSNNPTSTPSTPSGEVSETNMSSLWFEGVGQNTTASFTDDYGTCYVPEAVYTFNSTLKTNCMAEYCDVTGLGGAYTVMLGTDSGPRDSNFGQEPYFGTPPSGNVISLCALTDENGILNGKVLVATESNLWKYDSNEADAANRWEEVYLNGTTDSIAGMVTMVTLKNAAGAAGNEAIVARNISGSWRLGYQYNDGSTNYVMFCENTWDSAIGTINSLNIITIGAKRYLFYATSNGVYYRSLDSGSAMPPKIAITDDNVLMKLSALLDSINVVKIIDYDGKIGLLTTGNGLIVGPYPPLVW